MQNFFLGGSDPLLGSGNTSPQNIQSQLEMTERYRNELLAAQNALSGGQQPASSRTPIWDKIDQEILPLTELQQKTLSENPEYVEMQADIQLILQAEFLQQMKPLVEQNPQGKALLEKQYDLVRRIKKGVVEESNKEMQLFQQFQQYAAKNPKATYADFLETIKK